MNIQKFTQKSVEAINDCEKLAYEYGNQEIEQEHLLVALLQQEDGLILKLIEKMEIQKEHFLDNAKKHLAARVKVSGGQVYVGQDLNKVLIHAEERTVPPGWRARRPWPRRWGDTGGCRAGRRPCPTPSAPAALPGCSAPDTSRSASAR